MFPILGLLLGMPLLAMASGPQFGQRCAAVRGDGGVLRILHFGDSHLAAGSQSFRQFFQSRYGDGGPGLGLPWVDPQPGVATRLSSGWHKHRRPGGDGRIGLSAGFLETWKAGERAELAGAFSRYRLLLLKDPAGGKVQVTVDGAPQGELDLAGPAGQLAVFGQDLPAGAGSRRVELRTTRDGQVRVLGAALEARSGAVYSSLAFNGAQAAWLNGIPDPLFGALVAAEAPDLVILAFGTNEANGAEFNPEQYRKGLEAILARFRQAAPRAAVLLVGPPDGHLRQGSPGSLASVIAIQQAEAAACGGLFVDQRKAMGGAGAIDAWLQQGLANPDRVHLTAPGYRQLAQVVITGLLAGTGQAAASFPAPAARGRASAGPQDGPLPPVPASHPIYVYRRAEGGVLITDDPAKVEAQPGEWTRVAP